MSYLPQSRVPITVKLPGKVRSRAITSFGRTFTLKPHEYEVRKRGTSGEPVMATAASADATNDHHPWDVAHALADSHPVIYAEPDHYQEFLYPKERNDAAVQAGKKCPTAGDGINPDYPPFHADVPFGWYLDDDHSQLAAARRVVNMPARAVRIGHLDTGVDPDHGARPLYLNMGLGYNFEDDNDDATDPDLPTIPLLRNPGHGTATVALLAGRTFKTDGFDDFLGGAPQAEVVPVRIANGVVHFMTSSMSKGIRFAVGRACDVITISMGGIPGLDWADAVNDAYAAGTVIVAAAGNCFGRLPWPDLVWPARFPQCIAACGAMYGDLPYYLPNRPDLMQGCFGPPAAMGSAIGGYTPNVPWARLGCSAIVDRHGNGTSSATPQVAAAAALVVHTLGSGPQGPARVEAVKAKLFGGASKTAADSARFFGNGILRAAAAVAHPTAAALAGAPPAAPARVALDLVEATKGFGRLRPHTRVMLSAEAMQLAATDQRLAGWIGTRPESVPVHKRRAALRALRDHPGASDALRKFLRKAQP